jgi:hypothetical protein
MQRIGWTALAAALVMVGSSKLQAQDTLRLGGTGDAKVQTLEFDGQADTDQVYWRGGYRGWGRPYAGFYRPWSYRPFVYRPFVYRPWVYRPYYAYRPYYYSSPYAYYTPSYYYSAPAYSYYYADPCGTDTPSMPKAVVLGSSSYAQAPIFQTPSQSQSPRPIAPPQSGDGTFRYDGGPGQPMPLPGPEGPAPTNQKRPTLPLDGKLVSIPSNSSAGHTYAAYGETPRLPAQAPAKTSPVRVASGPAAATVRVAYPAFGDR